MKHIVVAREEGRFLGWPANDGVWSWADEIVVGYTNGGNECLFFLSVRVPQVMAGFLMDSVEVGYYVHIG